MAQKAAATLHKPEAPHTNGAVYQPKAGDIRFLLFDPADASNEEYRDLKVECRMKVPMSLYFKMAAPIEVGDPHYWEKAAERQREFAERALISWNAVYSSDHPSAGHPIPATPDGYMEIDIDTANAIRNAWFYTLRTPEAVVDPLGSESPSSDGAASAG